MILIIGKFDNIFDSFIEKLSKAGYGGTRSYYHFKDRNFEAKDGSARHELNGNLFCNSRRIQKEVSLRNCLHRRASNN